MKLTGSILNRNTFSKLFIALLLASTINAVRDEQAVEDFERIIGLGLDARGIAFGIPKLDAENRPPNITAKHAKSHRFYRHYKRQPHRHMRQQLQLKTMKHSNPLLAALTFFVFISFAAIAWSYAKAPGVGESGADHAESRMMYAIAIIAVVACNLNSTMQLTFSKHLMEARMRSSLSLSGLSIGAFSAGGIIMIVPFMFLTEYSYKQAYILHGVAIVVGNAITVASYFRKDLVLLLIGHVISGMQFGIKYTTDLVILRSVPINDRAYWLNLKAILAGAGVACGPAIPSILEAAFRPLDFLQWEAINRHCLPTYAMIIYGILYTFLVHSKFPSDFDKCEDVDMRDRRISLTPQTPKTKVSLIFLAAFIAHGARSFIHIGWDAGALVIFDIYFRLGDADAGLVLTFVSFGVLLGRSVYALILFYTTLKDLQTLASLILLQFLSLCLMYPCNDQFTGFSQFCVASTVMYTANLMQSAPMLSYASYEARSDSWLFGKQFLTLMTNIGDCLGTTAGPVATRAALESSKGHDASCFVNILLRTTALQFALVTPLLVLYDCALKHNQT